VVVGLAWVGMHNGSEPTQDGDDGIIMLLEDMPMGDMPVGDPLAASANGAAALLAHAAMFQLVGFSPGVAADLAQTAASGVPYDPEKARNIEHFCRPLALFNPDAGIGKVRAGGNKDAGQLATFTNVGATTESSSPAYWCWKDGTTKANVLTVCQKRCVGCNNGSAFGSGLKFIDGTLMCIVPDDGGVSWQLQLAL